MPHFGFLPHFTCFLLLPLQKKQLTFFREDAGFGHQFLHSPPVFGSPGHRLRLQLGEVHGPELREGQEARGVPGQELLVDLREASDDHMAMGQNPSRLASSEHPIQSNH